MNQDRKMPTYFISHGGGPWPWLKGGFRDACEKLKVSLEQLPRELPMAPKAILMISGHWEETSFKVMANPKPGMVYDYFGFPEETYKIKYSAPGSPELAHRVQTLLMTSGIRAELDLERGYDHGAFAPLAVSYPKADVPIVQLSLRQDLDAKAHLDAGRALAPLRDEGILIIGSGLSYHNLRVFDARAVRPSREFDAWLQETLLESDVQTRIARLRAWEKAPSAKLAHPREDHLIPLMVAVGAAENERAELCYHEDDFFGGIAVSSFRFGSSKT